MKSTTPHIRPLKRDDLDALYPGENLKTIRGLAVELDGQPIGICGVMYSMPLQAFSTTTDTLKKHPKAIIKCARMFRDILNSCASPVIALASEEEKTSERFLEHVGFQKVDGRYYLWPIQ